MVQVNQLSVKSKIMALLLGVSLGALSVAGVLSWLRFKSSFHDQVFEHLTAIRVSKGKQIEAYFRGVRGHVETLSEDRMLVAAMVEFNTTYRALQNQVIAPDWNNQIESHYRQAFLPQLSNHVQGTQIITHYLPISQASQYLQYHYIVESPTAVEDRITLDQAQDGSDYSQIHGRYHPIFRNLIETFGYRDLFLIDFDTGAIVYSVTKSSDFATNLDRGPYRRSSLATVVEAVRKNPGQGFVQMVDFQPYVPAYAAPVLSIAAPIFNGPHIVGIVAIQLPTDRIDEVLMDSQEWAQEGLGQTGQVYLVGTDSLMRSVSRTLLEDPEAYVDGLRKLGLTPQTLNLVEQLNTSVLLQPVETDATRLALAGNSLTQEIKGAQGHSVVSAFAPLRLNDLRWAIVAEMDSAEAFQPLLLLQIYLMVVAIAIIFVITWLANLASQQLVRPVQVLLDAMNQMPQDGKAELDINLNSDDEFGQLGKAINKMVHEIHDQHELLNNKERENEALLLNFLPSTVAYRLQRGETQIADSIQQVTILFAQLTGFATLTQQKSAEDVAEIINQLIGLFDEKATYFGLEQQNTLVDTYVAVCGLSTTYLDSSERTINCALEMLEAIPPILEQYQIEVGLKIGIHFGPLMAGIVGNQRLTYKFWGATVNIAAQLKANADLNTVLVTQPIYERLKDRYMFIPVQATEVEGIGEVPTWSLVTPTSAFMRQIELLQASMARCLLQSDAMGALFYDQIHKQVPPARHILKGDPLANQKKLIGALQTAVNGLSDLKQLFPVVQDLGRRYVGYRIKAEHYETVGHILLATLKVTLGDEFTPEVERAWRSAYVLLSNVMREATTAPRPKAEATV